jgi:hypothetical protein
MTGRWALSMPPSEAAALRGLRRAAGVQVCESASSIWLRGESCDERLEQRLRKIPGGRRFTVLADRQLQPSGGRVPDGFLPEGPWKPLADWLGVELPAAGWSGESSERLQITIERAVPPVDEATAAPTLLLTTLSAWAAYARTAPQVRLERWSFVADETGRVLVRGAPLPPLPGERFVEQGGVAVPLGWHWRPAVEPAIVREGLARECPALAENDLAISFRDGTWQRIPADSFVRADRSAVRLTAEAVR